MAPPRKKKLAPGEGREFKLRIPTDVADRIEKKAKREGRPQNRVIINELAATPQLELTADLADLIQNLQIILARYGSRITQLDLSEALLKAVDDVLAAAGNELPAAIERLRVARIGMKTHAATIARITSKTKVNV